MRPWRHREHPRGAAGRRQRDAVLAAVARAAAQAVPRAGHRPHAAGRHVRAHRAPLRSRARLGCVWTRPRRRGARRAARPPSGAPPGRTGGAQQGDLVTLGIRPTRAETGYGYLRRGAERGPGVFAVEAFVEKPDAVTARSYLQDPRYSWNAGIFVFRADALLEALRRHLPAVHEGLQQIGADEARAGEIFPLLPSISIDYGVLEPESSSTRRIALVAADDLGWSDVGSFATLPEVRELDARGNALSGDALAVDCADCVVLSEGGRLVAVLGLSGLCVVDSGDALLVVPRDRA